MADRSEGLGEMGQRVYILLLKKEGKTPACTLRAHKEDFLEC